MQTITTIALLLVAFTAVILASSDFGGDYYAYPQYKYNYGVTDKKTGDIKQAEEYRDGKVTKGSYSLLQPDGLVRTVKYVVDPKGGFQAQVLYKGAAGFVGGVGGYGLGNGVEIPVVNGRVAGVRYGGAIGSPIAGFLGGLQGPLGLGVGGPYGVSGGQLIL